MSVTAAQINAITDPIASTYNQLGGLEATNYLGIAEQYRIGNGSSQPSGLGYLNWAAMNAIGQITPAVPLNFMFNTDASQKVIQNINTYFASIQQGSLNTWFTMLNTSSYGTAYVKPNYAYLSSIALGYNPLTSTSTSLLMSPGNVEAPVTTYGAFVVSGTGGNTLTNYTSVPYANNSSAVNAVQNLIITATGGTFTIQVGNNPANVTSALAYNISASALQTALNALMPIYNSVATGTISSGFSVTYNGNCANQAMPLLTVNPASLTGGTAFAYINVLGGQQGYLPPALTTAVVTTTFNGTYSLTVNGAAIDSSGVYHAGPRTFTASLSSATSGTVVNLTPGTSGDRLVSVTNLTTSGTATAGAANLVSVLDR